jgi:uncharacterized protein (TIGR03790 family)
MKLAATILAAAAALVPAAPAADLPPDVAATVVVYNRNDPSSRELAKYYAERRGIPLDQVLGLDCPTTEEISRSEFLVSILAPLRDAFSKTGWWKLELRSDASRVVTQNKIRFMAIMRGVPLKVRRDAAASTTTLEAAPSDIPKDTPLAVILRSNEASVDSELSAINSLLDLVAGFIPNPYYRRYIPILDFPASASPLLVCRLDAPTDEMVRSMIDAAIETEKTGLWGWAYVDARSITAGGYKEGDDWMLAAARSMRKKGVPVISDHAPEVWGAGFPITDAAIYYGWYEPSVTGPFANSQFRFLPGAIAVHIHSTSAASLRDAGAHWAAPLIARGAAATLGNVYEPYLSFTVNLEILQDRLMSGLTLAESVYMANRGLSWMGIVVGDPLYRPYASWHSLDDPRGPATIWQRYRKAILDADGSPITAAPALRKLAKESGQSMPLEALAQAQAAENDFDTAIKTLDEASSLTKDDAVRFRLTLEKIEFLRRAGRKDDALAAAHRASSNFTSRSHLDELRRITVILDPASAPPPAPGPSR